MTIVFDENHGLLQVANGERLWGKKGCLGGVAKEASCDLLMGCVEDGVAFHPAVLAGKETNTRLIARAAQKVAVHHEAYNIPSSEVAIQ